MDDKLKLAQTEQLGRLVELCGNAIELTRGRKRDPKDIHEVIRALQGFKDKSSNYHICSCGHPHYERWGGLSKNAVTQICELRPGLAVRFNYNSQMLWESAILDYPYFKEGSWLVKMRHFMSESISAHGRGDEDEVEYLKFDNYQSGVMVRDGNNWLSYSVDRIPPKHECPHSKYLRNAD